MPLTEEEITTLLQNWSQGDAEALDKLMPRVYEELRQIAVHYFERESKDHTLQPTALVHEVYVRLVGRRTVHWESRAQFFAFAAQTMRRLLVDYARGRKADKRGYDIPKLSLDEMLIPVERDVDLLALDDALEALARIDPRQSQIVELRYFAGLSNAEIAQMLGISRTTVKREWKTARVWLYEQIRGG